MKKSKKKSLNKRFVVSIYLILAITLAYVIRLLYLQVFDLNDYKRKGENISRGQNIISPNRGAIYDSKGKPLAINVTVNTCYLYRAVSEDEAIRVKKIQNNKESYNKLDSKEKEEINLKASLPVYKEEDIEKISGILNIDKDFLRNKLEKGIETTIANRVSDEQKKELDKLNVGYIQYIKNTERYYPNKESFSQTLGFVEDDKGLYGLENYYNDLLSGEKGYQEFYKAIGGTNIPFDNASEIKFKKANNIVTTIDEEIQAIVHKHLLSGFKEQKALVAEAIVMDPNTGKVLAMDSFPSFDPNDPRKPKFILDDKVYEKYTDEGKTNYIVSNWNNPLVSHFYEPGSVFKSIVSSMALETNKKTLDKTYNCDGKYEIAPGVFIRCWRSHDPHGEQSMKEAFANSCNPAYVDIIKDVGKDNFHDYGKSFKFGEFTGIDLPNEVKGIFPKDSQIADVDFAPMGYGHSVSTTPIQLLSALNATVNGGIYYKPMVVDKVIDDENNIVFQREKEELTRIITEETSKTMRDFYGNSFNQVTMFTKEDESLKMGIKTGTTIKVNEENPYKSEKNKLTPTVASIFMTYPIEKPRYTVLVVFNEPLVENEGINTAGPVAYNIMRDIAYYENENKLDDNTIKNLIKVPKLTSLTIEEIEKVLEGKPLDVEIVGELGKYHIIDKQYPENNGYIEKDSTIKISQENKKKIKAPNLIDLKLKDAKDLLEKNYILYEIKGEGKKVIDQKPKANGILDSNGKITLITD